MQFLTRWPDGPHPFIALQNLGVAEQELKKPAESGRHATLRFAANPTLRRRKDANATARILYSAAKMQADAKKPAEAKKALQQLVALKGVTDVVAKSALPGRRRGAAGQNEVDDEDRGRAAPVRAAFPAPSRLPVRKHPQPRHEPLLVFAARCSAASRSSSILSVSAIPVDVEVDVAGACPTWWLVGLAGGAVQESVGPGGGGGAQPRVQAPVPSGSR